MKKEDLLTIGLSEDLAEKVATMSAEELKGFIPKTRFDEVNEAKKNAEALLKERDTQIATLSKNSELTDGLKKQISDLEEANKKSVADYEERIKTMKLDSAISEKLTGTQYKDLLAPKVDKTKLIINADGSISGLDEQINGLRESYKDLFTNSVSGRGEVKKALSGTSGNVETETLNKVVNDTSLSFAERISAFNKLSEKGD